MPEKILKRHDCKGNAVREGGVEKRKEEVCKTVVEACGTAEDVARYSSGWKAEQSLTCEKA